MHFIKDMEILIYVNNFYRASSTKNPIYAEGVKKMYTNVKKGKKPY